MAKKPGQRYVSSSSSDYELQCEAARKARQTKKWSKLALFALAITLLSPFVSASPVQIARAAALVPTPNTWTNHSSSTTGTSPTSVSRAMQVWDPDHSQVIIHGGFVQSLGIAISDTWKLDPSTGAWTESILPSSVPTTTVPPVRSAGCAVWDTANHQMLVFAGDNLSQSGIPMNKVWAFDPTGNAGAGAWKQYTVSGAEPSDGRIGLGCVWDPTAKKMLTFGGGSGGDDVWAFDPSTDPQNAIGTWTEVFQQSVPFACGRGTGATPGSRFYPSVVWNPVQNNMLIWGGEDTCGTASLSTLNNVWSFNPGSYGPATGSWTKLNSLNGGIGAREGAAALWDPTINQMVIFGGQGASYFNDVWNYSPTKGQWSKHTPKGTPPSARGYLATTFVPTTVPTVGGQSIYFGGDLGGVVPPTSDYLWGLGGAPQLGLKFSNVIPGLIAGKVVTTGTQVQLTSIDGTTVIPNSTGTPITVTVRVSAASNNSNCGFFASISNTPPALGCATPGPYTPTVDVHIQPGNTTSDEYFFYSDTLAGNRTVVGEATTDTSLSAIQAVTVTPDNPTSLVFTRQPSATAIQNVAFPQQPTVALSDAFSNTVTTAATTPVTLTLRSQGDVPPPAGATISGTTTLNTTNGVVAFTGLAITKGSSTPYQLKASAVYSGTALADALSTNITVNCIAGTSIVTILTDPTLPVSDNCQVSLRQAILNANTAASGSVTQTVTFGTNLLTTPVSQTLQTITLSGQALPTLAAGVKIDAGCDVITPTAQIGQRGRPRIAIDGSGITSLGSGQTSISALALSNGITNTGNLVNGLAIVNVPGYGIVINNSSDNTITCNYIGTDDGISAKPNLLGGIYINNTNAVTLTGRTNNIGLSGSPTSGNLISGNGATGNGAAQVEAKGVGAKTFLYHNFLGYNFNRVAPARLTSAPNTGGPVLKYSGRARVVLKQGNWLRR